jgi:phosphoglycerate dehydrogenase-like enzyme
VSVAVGAVLPRPLADDFDTAADMDGVLRQLELHVVEDLASGSSVLDHTEILITGISTQTVSALELARAMPRLRWIHSMTAGIEDLLAEPLLERQIVLTNAAGAYAVAMAEYAFTAMVLLARRIPELLVAASRQEWRDPHPLGTELAGRRVGVVGYGGIGRALGRLCACAGMSVWGLRRHAVREQDDPAERVLAPAALTELLEASDFVVVAASLNPSSRGLLGHAQFEAMKPGAFLVNVSRGALVDEAALVAALRSGRLAGAIVDVAGVEPLPAESELWNAPSLWITPHMSGGTLPSRRRAFELLLANCSAYLAGHLDAMLNRVDLALELAAAEGAAC